MKILHTIAGFGTKSGGTTSCTYDLLEALNRNGTSTDLLTPDIKRGSNDRLAGEGEAWIKKKRWDCLTPYAFSFNMRRYLARTDYDLYHTNGLWLDINHATSSLARRRNKPYVITTHGMLYPKALARSARKKEWMRKLFFDKDLREAACIHVTCEQEGWHIHDLGFRTPIAVIGNPVHKPENLDAAIAAGSPQRETLAAVGYLGRLHPVKNVDRIIEAFARVSKPEQRLVIMGSGEPEYEQMLHELVAKLGVKDRVEFRGFVRGQEKWIALAGLRSLVVASDFENFGMIVGESLLAQTPVICTRTAPWQDLNTFDCGRWVDNDVEHLGEAIYAALNTPLYRIETQGRNGRELIEKYYNPDVIAAQMTHLYEWLLGKEEKPAFVK